ncbi:tetratricopeptide repeat protein [Thioalbus denitrificans]|uniref:Tetratricopeptide repeat protein n=2 Tax=Thioalbus denitrificans TaxID=547122 RepID=A0A369C1R5_9GAMM|nr:tetratricopeptide repeat protein [Thioalbus denitrificans]
MTVKMTTNAGLGTACLMLLALAGCASAPYGGVPVEDRSVHRGEPAPRPAPVEEASGATTAPAGEWTVTPARPLPPGQPAGSPDYSAPATARPSPYPDARPEAAPAGPASPAVVALLETAREQQNADRLAEAAASLERAVRIEPRNARVWYELATVRFRQGQLQQAEQLARKSDALAGPDNTLRARNWRLIALVRMKLGDNAGAVSARRQAEELEVR